MNRDDVILVDTNVIIEAHRVSILNEILGSLNLATVCKCIEETQTGAQNRDPRFNIDESLLRARMQIFSPTDEEILLASMQRPGLADVDAGELHLLTQANQMNGNVWFVSSPDRHPMRLAIEYGWRDRLVSLEALYRLANANRRVSFRENFTEAWHQRVCAEFLMQVRR